ncbi:hypothetical protein [Candidatus Albibeggiatoa sp. nov. NOAA]|uniref:hypothetical protein n=1 Tax=Candidatus Albibeggiatoa sp. nov. NOAA TaxID=3162724 RepID=UPI0032F15FC5|nr:hypothetical protein [Thiotrichaceae bacterium]
MQTLTLIKYIILVFILFVLGLNGYSNSKQNEKLIQEIAVLKQQNQDVMLKMEALKTQLAQKSKTISSDLSPFQFNIPKPEPKKEDIVLWKRPTKEQSKENLLNKYKKCQQKEDEIDKKYNICETILKATAEGNCRQTRSKGKKEAACEILTELNQGKPQKEEIYYNPLISRPKTREESIKTLLYPYIQCKATEKEDKTSNYYSFSCKRILKMELKDSCTNEHTAELKREVACELWKEW